MRWAICFVSYSSVLSVLRVSAIRNYVTHGGEAAKEEVEVAEVVPF